MASVSSLVGVADARGPPRSAVGSAVSSARSRCSADRAWTRIRSSTVWVAYRASPVDVGERGQHVGADPRARVQQPADQVGGAVAGLPRGAGRGRGLLQPHPAGDHRPARVGVGVDEVVEAGVERGDHLLRRCAGGAPRSVGGRPPPAALGAARRAAASRPPGRRRPGRRPSTAPAASGAEPAAAAPVASAGAISRLGAGCVGVDRLAEVLRRGATCRAGRRARPGDLERRSGRRRARRGRAARRRRRTATSGGATARSIGTPCPACRDAGPVGRAPSTIARVSRHAGQLLGPGRTRRPASPG